MLSREIFGQTGDQALGLLGVCAQNADDVLHRYGIMVRMPAIEVGHHRHRRVADLRFAGELGLRHVGHANHRVPEILVGHALSIGRELRTFDADISAATRDRDPLGVSRTGKVDAQSRRDRMRH